MNGAAKSLAGESDALRQRVASKYELLVDGVGGHRLAALEAGRPTPGGEQHILAALEDAAPSVRDRAIRLAARYVEPAVLGELVADGENAVRRNAGLSALERQGPMPRHLVAMLGRDDAELALFALQSLSRIGSAPAGPAILPLLDHPDPNVVEAAIEAVGKLRVSEAVPALCGLLQRDLWLQLAAIAALGEIGHPGAVGSLMAFVRFGVAEPAVQALRRIAAPESLQPLPLLLAVRERALRDPLLLAVAVVIDLHPDPAPLMNRVERDVVVDGGNRGLHLGQLLAAAPDADDGEETESLLRAAATLVAAAGIAELQPMVLARLAKDGMAQWIEGLMARFPQRVAPHLHALLEHPDPDVRCGALRVGLSGRATCRRSWRSSVIPSLPSALRRASRWGGWHRRGCPAPARAPSPRRADGAGRRRPRSGPAVAGGAGERARLLSRARYRRAGHGGGARGPGADPGPCVGAPRPPTRPRRRARRSGWPRFVPPPASPGPSRRSCSSRALADRHQPIQTEALELLVRRGGDRTVATMVALLGFGAALASTSFARWGVAGRRPGRRGCGSLPRVRSPRAVPDRLVAAPDRSPVALPVPPPSSG